MADTGKLTPAEDAVFTQYYLGYFEKLQSLAYYLTGDHALAEFAAQETFLVVLLKYHDFISHPNPVGWMFTVLRNITKNLMREKQAFSKRFMPLELADEIPANNPDIAILPDKCSTDEAFILLRLFYVDGYSLRELADGYHTTVGAMKMRIYRAKKDIRSDPGIQEIFRMSAESPTM